MAKVIQEVAILLLYLAVGVLIGSVILFSSEDINSGLAVGGAMALTSVATYAFSTWRLKRRQLISPYKEKE